MFSSMSSWLGISSEKAEAVDEANKENQNTDKGEEESENKEKTDTKDEEGDGDIDKTLDAAKHKLEDVSSKALNAAKEWGSKSVRVVDRDVSITCYMKLQCLLSFSYITLC